jgi:hypothetical protein
MRQMWHASVKSPVFSMSIIGIVGRVRSVSGAHRGNERNMVRELEVIRITYGDVRVPEFRFVVVDGSCAGVKFLLQQVDVRIAR